MPLLSLYKYPWSTTSPTELCRELPTMFPREEREKRERRERDERVSVRERERRCGVLLVGYEWWSCGYCVYVCR